MGGCEMGRCEMGGCEAQTGADSDDVRNPLGFSCPATVDTPGSKLVLS